MYMRERILMEYCRVHVIDYVTKTLTRTGPMCCQSFKHSSHPKFRIRHAGTLFKTLCLTTLSRILTPSVSCGQTGFKEHNINHEPRLSAMFVARAEVNKHVLIPGACLHITMTQRDSRHSSHIQSSPTQPVPSHLKLRPRKRRDIALNIHRYTETLRFANRRVSVNVRSKHHTPKLQDWHTPGHHSLQSHHCPSHRHQRKCAHNIHRETLPACALTQQNPSENLTASPKMCAVVLHKHQRLCSLMEKLLELMLVAPECVHASLADMATV